MSQELYEVLSDTELDQRRFDTERCIVNLHLAEERTQQKLNKTSRELAQANAELRLRTLMVRRVEQMESNGSKITENDSVRVGKLCCTKT